MTELPPNFFSSGIEELKGKRIDLDGQIAEEQSHQASLQTELESLTAEIYTCNQGLSQKARLLLAKYEHCKQF